MKLDTDKQFIPTEAKISALCALYDAKVSGYEVSKSGIENCTIIVTTTDRQKIVLRVYRQGKKTDAAIQEELEFIDYLHLHKVQTVPALPNKAQEKLSHFDEEDLNWQVIAMPFIEGEHFENYPTELLQDIAVTQAKMRQLAEDYNVTTKNIPAVTELKEGHFIKLMDKASFGSDLQDFISRIENYVVKLDADLPKGLCHMDFDGGNLLAKDNKLVAVLDFDDLTIAPFIMCVAYTLWDVFYESGDEKFSEYLTAYETIRPLNELEKQFFWPIVLFRHYVIACVQILMGDMDEAMLLKYLDMEKEINSRINSGL